MKKRFFCLFLALLITFTISPFSKANAETDPTQEENYTENEDGICQSNTEEALQENLDQSYSLYQELESYISKNFNGVYVFDEEKALLNENMTEFNILTGHQLAKIKNDEEAFGEAAVYNDTIEQKQEMNEQEAATEPPVMAARGFSFTMWNYCGPGNSGGTPKNGIDKICKVHDNCYDKKGWGSCSCDKAIADSMGYAAANSKYTKSQRAFAAAASAHFTQRYYTRMCKWW